jgi:alpha-L-rhamnosidase
MSKIAKLLKKKADAEKYMKLFNDIKKNFNKEFVTSTGCLVGSSQTAYVLALSFNILNEVGRKRTEKELVRLINEQGVVTCGILGASYILDVLTNIGNHEFAQKLALKQDFPSWLYPITQGATSIWEGWNAIDDDGLHNSSTNSLNSYAFGAVCNWYYEKVAGILPDEENPGYKHFFLHPRPTKELFNAEAKLKTHYGTIKIKYDMDISNNNIVMSISIPDNTNCTLILDDCKVYEINEKRKRYKDKVLLQCGNYDISYIKGGSMLSLF